MLIFTRINWTQIQGNLFWGQFEIIKNDTKGRSGGITEAKKNQGLSLLTSFHAFNTLKSQKLFIVISVLTDAKGENIF